MSPPRPIRICVIGLRGIPGVPGGVETHCEQLLPGLKRLRPDDEVYLLARRQYVEPGIRMHEGVHVVPLPHLRTKSLEAITSSILGVLYAAARIRADVIHIHAIGPALVAPLAKLLRMRVVITHHGTDYDRSQWNWFAKLALRTGEAFAIRFADRLVVVSPTLTSQLQARHPRYASKIQFIPNGANHLRLENDALSSCGGLMKRLGLAPKSFVLAVGRLVPEKGFHELVQAHAMSGTDCKLVIAGGPGHDIAYADRLRSAASERVVFPGAVDREELAVLLKGASLFVLPSHHEGLPIAALEAAIAGTPLLLSDIAANRDIGLPASHYFTTGDVSELSRRLAEPHEAFALRDTGILATFDWNRVCRETDAVYTAVTA